MKNYITSGDTFPVASAPYTLVSGAGCLVGSQFGVAMSDAANNAPVTLQVVGIVDLVKTASQSWTVGARIYWDNSTKACTTVAAAGANALIGTAVLAVGGGGGETTGRVRLSGACTI